MSERTAATRAISAMLYSDPIYKWIPEGENCLNVFAYGEDEYTYEFLDQCLQTGQMLQHRLNITVLTDKPKVTADLYLLQRPVLKDFINVDGTTVPEGKIAYGNLRFYQISRGEESEKAHIEDLLLNMVADENNEHFHYVFVSTGSDEKNRSIASCFTSAAKDLNVICSVHYIAYDKAGFDNGHGIPVCIDAVGNPVLQEMERMAFNVHLCWKGFYRASLRKEQESFYRSENWKSSLLFVTSLPYKLYSLNIDTSDIYQAAKMLDDLLQSHDHDEKLYLLAELEHRRWLIEKVCSGWKAPSIQNGHSDYSFCLRTLKNSDPGKKINTCILRSTSVFPLQSWTEDMWNYEEKKLSQLDDFDRMSIDLHRMYKAKGDSLSSETIESIPEIQKLKQIVLQGTTETNNCFEHYCLCIKSIIDGSKGYSKRYNDYRSKLLSIVRKELPSSLLTVESLLETITKIVFPAIQRNLFVDYKRIDLDLLRKIPFVLTYSQPENVIIAYPDNIDTVSDALLHCVSSITALRPKRATFLTTVSEKTSIKLLTDRMKSIRRYLNGQRITIPMDLKIAYAASSDRNESDYKDLCSSLSKLHKDFTSIGYKVQKCADHDAVLSFYLSSAHEYANTIIDGSNPYFGSCRKNACFITEAERDGIPYVEYDLMKRSFTVSSDCMYSCYIHDESYMQASDMFALMGAEIISTEYPAYAAVYPKLKRIYLGDATHLGFKKSVRAWNILVSKMKQAQAGAVDLKQISFDLTNEELKDGIKFADIMTILNALQTAAIISNLSSNDRQQRVSFLICDDLYLGIFKNEGSMLEIYTFFEACATGVFDDVNTGLKFSWMNSIAENELDGVLTFGYQSLVVECKDRKGRVTDFIHKIDSVAMHFGLGTQKIMVLTRPKESANPKDEQYLMDLRARCKAMNVQLLIGENDIRNIGNRLSAFVERK